jgi:hypothetical protein
MSKELFERFYDEKILREMKLLNHIKVRKFLLNETTVLFYDIKEKVMIKHIL